MTTHNYRLDLNDSEYMALERALHIMIAHCDEQMAKGPKCPHWAIKHGCEAILEKLYAAPARQMSSYTPPQTLEDFHGGITDLVRGKAKKEPK